jgi:uncharacterized iron-regulated membrane protein
LLQDCHGLLNRAGHAFKEGFPKEVFASRPLSTSDNKQPDASMSSVVEAAHKAGIFSGYTIEYPWGEQGSYAIMPLRHTQKENLVYYAFIDHHSADILLTIDKEKLGAVGRATSVGVQFHEGRLFGKTNQLVNALAVSILIGLTLSGWVMWFKRKPKGAFGAPHAVLPQTHRKFFVGILIILCLFLPLFAASNMLILVYEKIMRRKIANKISNN